MNRILQTDHKVQANQNSSWSFLEKLNGKKKGPFARYLAEKKTSGQLPRIAWYPSSGQDMRDLLYLSPAYEAQCQQPNVNPTVESPDLFLHTDYFPWSDSRFLDTHQVFSDHSTKIDVLDIEELPRLTLPLSPELVHFRDGSVATHRVLFLRLSVSSNRLGVFTVPLLYVFSENCAFADFALKQGAQFSHFVHVRFGGSGGGGGNSSGIWMLNILGRLGCECLVSDDHYYLQPGDKAAMRIFPSLRRKSRRPLATRTPFRAISGQSWSDVNRVTWYRTR